jgi:UPF0755 protein
VKYFVVLILLVVLAAGGTAAWFWYSLTQPYQGFSAQGVFVDVPRGASSRTVARLLERNGVIRSAKAFEIYARRHPKRALQAGEYQFAQPASGLDVFSKIAKGEVYEQPFTVREGETMFDIARELEAGKFMRAGDFLFAAGDTSLIRDFAPGALSLEGFLFPATYELPRHPSAKELTAEMVKKFREKWTTIQHASFPDATSGYLVPSPKQNNLHIVTLASLVERETPKPDERPLVAGVFENRLRLNMRLQCDPTVVYALERAGLNGGKLSLQDLRYDSPYNTYANRGLPPGPIGNPGEASLRAALEPAESNYLYFVANTQGGHFFSSTLAEHNRNVTKYHRLLAGLPADPPESEAVPKPAGRKQPQKHATKRPLKHQKRAVRGTTR